MGSGRVILGNRATQLGIDDTVPIGEVGIDMSAFSGATAPDGWIVEAELSDETTNAKLDLDTPSAALDTIVNSARYLGEEGNSVTVAAVADSGAGEGVVIEEDLSALTVVIHFEDGVSTVAQVEAAILADSDLLGVDTPGTGGTILTSADAFSATPLAGGASGAATGDVNVWVRDPITYEWGLYDDVYGNVVAGFLIDGMDVGRRMMKVRDLGLFDRVYFTREGSGAGDLDVTLIEVLVHGEV